MKRTANIIFLSFFFVFLFLSCKKYDDGPSFTLLSKRARVTGVWKFESASYRGVDITQAIAAQLGSDYYWDLKRDGSYYEGGKIDDGGVWRLIEDKERISFSSSDTVVGQYSYKIQRLTNKEFWMSEVVPSSGFTLLLKYKQ